MERTKVHARPLVLAVGSDALDRLMSAAAIAGVEVDVVVDAAPNDSVWRSAPLVLVADEPDACTRVGERRTGVLLVSWDLDDADVWRRAYTLGADHVVLLPDGREWLVERLADAAEDAGSGTVVTVVGARGGAGASTVASALALHAAASGLRTVLVDADASGAGIDLVLGAEDVPGVRWPDLALVEGRIPGGALVQALPRTHGLSFLSCTRDQLEGVAPEALDAVVMALRRVGDLVVIDAPRTDVSLLNHVLPATDLLLIVSPAEVRAVAAGQRWVHACGAPRSRVRTIARMPGGGELSAASVAEAVGALLIGEVKDDSRAASAIDRGEGVDLRRKGPWREVCDSVLALAALPTQAIA